MAFTKQTIEDIDVAGKTVLVRADFNVPLSDDYKITDDYRITQALPTISYLIEHGAKVVVCSHLGRPDGVVMAEYSLQPVAKRLGELLNKPVIFCHETVGDVAKQAVEKLKPGDVLLLENLRFASAEELNDESFGHKLAELADIFVQDGFGVVHRAHASTEAVTRFIPSVAGLLVAKEVATIDTAIEDPQRPLMAIIGGAKIADKIGILRRFIEIADVVVVGGAMANTFLLAKDIEIGKSLANKADVPLAKEILAMAEKRSKEGSLVFYLPQDGVVAKKIDSGTRTRIVDWGAHTMSDIEHYPKRPPQKSVQVQFDELILDIGPISGSFIAGAIQSMKTVVWNGAMGVTETKGLHGPIGPFAHGTETVIDALLGSYGNKPFSVIGGGDTVGYIEGHGLVGIFGHVSTGGGASMELMSGKTLPGVEALMEKK